VASKNRKTQIRSTKDLPAWFDVSKYSVFSEMDWGELHAQLSSRRRILSYCGDSRGAFEEFTSFCGVQGR
jgi:hypothetical protein